MTKNLKVVAFVFYLQLGAANEKKNGIECSSTGICLAKDYDKHIPALKPINVDIYIHINQIIEVDDALGTIDLMAYFEFSWVDNRLSIGNNTFSELKKDWYDRLSFPDIHMYEMMEINLPQLKSPHMSDYIGMLFK